MSPTTNTESGRFRVRADAFYVRHGDGVWLRNNNGSFSITGAGAYELVDSLFANLDGTRCLDELVDGLPEPTRASVLRLVTMMERNGFLKPVEFPPEVVPDWMARRFAAHLAFLDHHADRPVARLLRARTRRVACVGAGVALRGLLGALGESGVAELQVITGQDGAADIADLVGQARLRDPRSRWRTLVAGDRLDLAAAGVLPECQDADVVLLAVDSDDPAAVAGFEWRCRRRGQPCGVLGRCGDHVVALPPHASADRCWECVHRWIAGPVTGPAGDLDPAVAPATIAALHLAQHTFALLAEITLDGADTIATAEPLAPIVRSHQARRHPACHRHGASPQPVAIADPLALTGEPVRAAVPAPDDPADLVAISDRIVAITGRWTDRVAGPLLSVGEEAADQLPLSASECALADPASRADAPVVRRFRCLAVSPREARNQVVLAALGWLGDRLGGAETVHAAGWSPAEAWYRAVAAASRALPVDTVDWSDVPDRWHGGDPLREFLTGTLAATPATWTALAIRQLPTGFVRVDIRGTDWSAFGVGVDERHATDDALLRAIAGPGALVAELPPPVDSWADAVALLTKQGGDTPVTDVSSAIPFLDGDAFVFATPVAAR